MSKDYYAILGVKPTATDDEIKKQYRQLSKLYHPDVKKGSEDKFAEISEAYSIIGDPEKRKAYAEEKQKEMRKKQAPPQGAGSSAQQQKFTDPIAAMRAQSYKEGYNQATSDAKKAYEPQIETLKKTLALYEKRLQESEKYRSSERGEVKSHIEQLLIRLRNEENLRLKKEAELDKLKSEYNALSEELELAYEAIDGFASKNKTASQSGSSQSYSSQSYGSQSYSNQSYAAQEEEEDAYEEYDYEEATVQSDEDFWTNFDIIEKKALAGDGTAQNTMGEYYFYGTGVEQNYRTALEWFKKAANNKNADGLFNYGTCFFNGEGVPEDPITGEHLIKMSAKNGNKVAITFCNEQGWEF